MSAFLNPHLFLFLFLALPASADINDQKQLSCTQRFFQTVRNFIVGEEIFLSSYSFAQKDLDGVKGFLTQQSGIKLEGFNEKMVKLQGKVLERYSQKVNPEAVNAFGVLHDFTMSDGEFSATVKIDIVGDKLIVEISNVVNKSARSLGAVSKAIDFNLARFFVTATKGIEYRLSLNKNISLVEINPSKVVNRKLKGKLEELGFKKISELRDWGEIKGFREGMGPAAEYEMHVNVVRSLEH